jgi:hypothetical protein
MHLPAPGLWWPQEVRQEPQRLEDLREPQAQAPSARSMPALAQLLRAARRQPEPVQSNPAASCSQGYQACCWLVARFGRRGQWQERFGPAHTYVVRPEMQWSNRQSLTPAEDSSFVLGIQH